MNGFVRIGKQNRPTRFMIFKTTSGMKIYRQNENLKWTVNNFPFDEDNLNPNVQEKAVEIANQLYASGRIEGPLLYREAVRRAKKWFLDMEG